MKRRNFLFGRTNVEGKKPEETEIEQPADVTKALEELPENDPKLEEMASAIAEEKGLNKDHVYLSLIALAGAGVGFSSPAQASDVYGKIVDGIVEQFSGIIMETLGGLFGEITGFIDDKSVKEGAAIAGLGDALNEMQKSIQNKQLALDAVPAPGECESMTWADQELRIQDDLQENLNKENKSRAAQISSSISTLFGVKSIQQVERELFQETQNALLRASGSNIAEKVINYTSPDRLKPESGQTYNQNDLQSAELYLNMLFKRSESRTLVSLSALSNTESMSDSEQEAYLLDVKQLSKLQLARKAFEADKARFTPAANRQSKAENRERFVKTTILSEKWHKEIQESASSVPLLKSLVMQQVYSNQLLAEMYDQNGLTQKLLAMSLTE